MTIERNRKPTMENIAGREESITRMKLQIAELKSYLQSRDSDWWIKRQMLIEDKIASLENHLENFETMTERAIVLNLAEWVMLRKELRSYDDAEQAIVNLEKAIFEEEENIRERRERLGVTSA